MDFDNFSSPAKKAKTSDSLGRSVEPMNVDHDLSWAMFGSRQPIGRPILKATRGRANRVTRLKAGSPVQQLNWWIMKRGNSDSDGESHSKKKKADADVSSINVDWELADLFQRLKL